MARKKTEDVDVSKVYEATIEDVLHRSMLPYAEYVIMDRALPRVEDGLKPVQRRILYAMLELGITPDKQHRKSARVVGDCLGKYHPHGDTSIYDAMVRLAQPFNTRMTLVDGHGNFGSIDGDNAAAMRYTEVRMMPLALELMRDIEKDTVTWSLNFDDTLKEPDIFPGKYPNLLVNGATGIAVGLATNIPPHNLAEVIDGVIAQIERPRITLQDMMKIIKGPDFPTGGIIIADNELENAYKTGRGRIKIRAKYTIEKDRDRTSMVIQEVPYQVNKARLLQKINKLRESKLGIFSNISDIVDESDRNGLRAVIKFKNGTNVNKMVQSLIAKTQLEVSFGINMVAIANGKPQQMGLLDITTYYIDYQRRVLINRTKFDLNAARERKHILEGLIIAIENIHKVIDIIKSARNTTEAKQSLREKFLLSERQAQAILDMKLSRLAKLEVEKLKEEIEILKGKINEYEAILASKRRQDRVMIQELSEIKRKFKDERRSQIVGANSTHVKSIDIKDINEREKKEGIVILTQAKKLKCISKRSYLMADKSAQSNDIGSLAISVVENSNENDVIGFTNFGNAVTFNIDSLGDDRWKSRGVDISKVSDKLLVDEKLIRIFDLKDFQKGQVYFYTKNGNVKKSNGSEYNLDKRNYQALVLKNEDELLDVELVDPTKTIFFVTKEGICLNCQTDNIPLQGRISGGVRCIKLNESDSVIFAKQVDDEGEIITISDTLYAKRVIIALVDQSVRDRKGLKICDLGENLGKNLIFASAVKMPYDLSIAIDPRQEPLVVNSEDISIESRASRGKAIEKLSKDESVTHVVSNSEIMKEI